MEMFHLISDSATLSQTIYSAAGNLQGLNAQWVFNVSMIPLTACTPATWADVCVNKVRKYEYKQEGISRARTARRLNTVRQKVRHPAPVSVLSGSDCCRQSGKQPNP